MNSLNLLNYNKTQNTGDVPLVIHVRTLDEFNEGHIPGASTNRRSFV